MELYLCIDPHEIPSAQQKGATARAGRVYFYEKSHIKEFRKMLVAALRNVVADKKEQANAYVFGIEYVYRPATLRKADFGQPKTTAPDLDNITKLVQDAISDALIAWRDDRVVTTVVERKRYAQEDELEHLRILILEDKPLPLFDIVKQLYSEP